MAEMRHIVVPCVFVRQAAHETAEVSNQLLFGESVRIVAEHGPGWLEIESEHDGYHGFIPSVAAAEKFKPSHKVCVPLTHVYEHPDFKSAVLSPLFFHSRVQSNGQTENGFFLLDHGGWIFKEHLCDLNSMREDFVETALLFKNGAYMWGGRTIGGIDCSGLVQISLMAAGLANIPRDTKDQLGHIGKDVPVKGYKPMRGDLVFFPRHVGIMIDDTLLLNATARHMQVVIEPLCDVEKAYQGITGVQRL